jgi:hypothetical protein
MLALVKPTRRVALPPAVLFAPPLVVLINLFLYWRFVVMEFGGTADTDPYLVTDMWLLVVLAAVGLASCAARALGWASRGSAAGLSLAAFALAGRDTCETIIRLAGIEGYYHAYDWVPELPPFIWVSRNLTLVAFGYGLGLVVFATIADVMRRRHDPACAIDDA